VIKDEMIAKNTDAWMSERVLLMAEIVSPTRKQPVDHTSATLAIAV
jgi:hypothetical protein